MIHHVRSVESLENKSKTPHTSKVRRHPQFTVKFDAELMDQMEFLAKHLEIKKLEIHRQLIKEKISEMRLWKEYQKFEKPWKQKELLKVKN